MPLFSVIRKFNRSNPACKITSTAETVSKEGSSAHLPESQRSLWGAGQEGLPTNSSVLARAAQAAQNTAIIILLLRRAGWEMGPNCACQLHVAGDFSIGGCHFFGGRRIL